MGNLDEFLRLIAGSSSIRQPIELSSRDLIGGTKFVRDTGAEVTQSEPMRDRRFQPECILRHLNRRRTLPVRKGAIQSSYRGVDHHSHVDLEERKLLN